MIQSGRWNLDRWVMAECNSATVWGVSVPNDSKWHAVEQEAEDFTYNEPKMFIDGIECFGLNPYNSQYGVDYSYIGDRIRGGSGIFGPMPPRKTPVMGLTSAPFGVDSPSGAGEKMFNDPQWIVYRLGCAFCKKESEHANRHHRGLCYDCVEAGK